MRRAHHLSGSALGMVGTLRFAHPKKSFAKRTRNILHVPAPIGNELASLHIAMKTAMRPVGDLGDVPVLHGIEMNVIDMPFEI